MSHPEVAGREPRPLLPGKELTLLCAPSRCGASAPEHRVCIQVCFVCTQVLSLCTLLAACICNFVRCRIPQDFLLSTLPP